MMLLLPLVVEDFWARPRLAGFGSAAAAAPEQTQEQFRAVRSGLQLEELFHFIVLDAAARHIQLNW